MREIIDTIREQLRLPRVNGALCVHALIEGASCRACIEVCPRGAWRLGEESLGIAVDACDGCGLCAPACPEGAIGFDRPLEIRLVNGRKTLLLACERAGLERGHATTPCLHGAGIGDLLRLHRDEVRTITLCRGDCGECDRGGGVTLGEKIDALNGLLSAWGLPGIACLEIPPRNWPRLWKQSRPAVPGADLNRRQFLRRALSTAAQEAARSRLEEERERPFTPPGRLLPPLENDADGALPFPVLPRIDPLLCSGCDACVRVCPHGALTLEEGREGPGYRIDASSCTGCKVCADICEEEAVEIRRWQTPEMEFVPLAELRCRICGAPFHLPEQQPERPSTCRICSRTDHYRNLYQVLE